MHCPNCNEALPAGAIICVSCGYHLKEGRVLRTVVEPAPATIPSTQDDNPYRAPSPHGTYAVDDSKRVGPTKNYDPNTRLEWLENRVRELERRIDGTWLTAPGFFTRMWAVFGYAVLAYLSLVFVFFVIAIGFGFIARL